MDPNLNAPQEKQSPDFPDGFENWPKDDQQKFEENKQKLKKVGIKIEIVEAQMGLAMYDEEEKTLKIRHDADADFIDEYINNTVDEENTLEPEIVQEIKMPEKFRVQVGTVASETHPDKNEDSILSIPENGTFAVFDGMGGYFGGEIASNLAKEHIEEILKNLPTNLSLEEIKQELEKAIFGANEKINQKKSEAFDLRDMGTTASIVKIWEGENGERKAVIANVGDSRVYVMRANGTMEQITLDHSHVHAVISVGKSDEGTARAFQTKVSNLTDLSILTDQEKNLYNMRNLITRAIGSPDCRPNTYIVDLNDGDKIVLTSDGIHDNLTDNEITAILTNPDTEKERIVDVLVANSSKRSKDSTSVRAKKDDMSAIVVEISKKQIQPESELTPLVQEITPPYSTPEPSLASQEKKEEEKLVLNLDEIKNIVNSQIGGKAKVERLNLSEISEGLLIDAELNAGLAGGKIVINGKIVNAGNEITVSDLDIQARGYVKSMIENNLSNFGTIIKSYFEKQKGKPISSIQIQGSSLVIKFEDISQPPPSYHSIPEPAPVAQKGPEKEVEIRLDDNLKIDLIKTREKYVKAQVGANKKENRNNPEKQKELEDARTEYEEKRKILEKEIREKTQEEGQKAGISQGEINEATNDTIFEELVVKEHDAYLEALRANREETWKDRVKIETAKVLSNKAVRWYFRQNKWVRLGITTAIATSAGIVVGNVAAGGALIYGGHRLARGATSFASAGVANKWAQKKWSIDEINKDEKWGMDQIRTSDESLEAKEKAYKDLKEAADKERKRRLRNKTLVTVSAGLGAGLLSGLTEHVIGRPDIELPHAPKPPGVPTEKQLHTLGTKIQAETLAKPTASTELVHNWILEAKDGDSVWKLTEKALQNNPKFAGLQDEAERTYVVSSLVNKIMEDPSRYALGPKGELLVGHKFNLGSITSEENQNWLSKIIDKAEKLSGEQKQNIINNNAKIATYLHNNPDTELTSEKVTEILNTKPGVSQTSDVGQELIPPEMPPIVPSEIETPEAITPIPKEAPMPENVPATEEIPPPINPRMEPTLEDLPKPKTALQEQIESDIATAKQRLEVLEQSRNGSREGIRSMMGDISVEQGVEKAFRNAIDTVYGHHGLFRNVAGVDTKEWGFMRGLEANKVLKYFRDPENLDLQKSLPKKVLAELGNSEKHRSLVEQVTGLMDKANELARERGGVDIDFKPFDNGENMEAFIKRLGAFLMKK